MADFSVQIIKGWLLGSYEDKERFHEATNYKYEDYIYSAVPGEQPYFVGDYIGEIPAGCHFICDEGNLIGLEAERIICEDGITEQIDEWRPILANAGYTEDECELFYEPLVYLIAHVDY